MKFTKKIWFYLFSFSFYYFPDFQVYAVKNNMVQIRCLLPVDIRFNRCFKMEFTKFWINMESIMEILDETVVETRDSQGKILYSFMKKS